MARPDGVLTSEVSEPQLHMPSVDRETGGTRH
jgi:hypothetical protein